MLHSDSIVIGEPTSGTAKAGTDTSLVVAWWQGKSGRGTVLLIVHGMGEHGGRYRHVPSFLGEDFERFYALDQRGHGRSGGLRGYAPSFEAFLEDLKRVTAEIQEREKG